jgi:hypothetical protein
MIKKLCSLSAVFVFALAILFLSIEKTSIGAQPSLAAASLRFTVSEEATPSAEPKVNYYLPYPGILPDSPLYKIKMVRDRVWLWLTPEPVNKAEKLLLYADKRVGAGKTLIEGGQVPLGISTILKGEKYLERAILETEKAQKQGLEVKSLVEKLEKACLGHEEILLSLKQKVNSEGQESLGNMLTFLKTLQNKTSGLND